MRPIVRGGSPIGRPEFGDYTQAFPYLIRRLGNYCSYCERYFEANLAVEHKSPKDIYKKEERKWKNFLIGCTQCNSTKSIKNVNPNNWGDYVWPDHDDTYHMIDYLPLNAYKATPSNKLKAQDKIRVQRTLELVNLNKWTKEYDIIVYKSKLAKRREVAEDCKNLKRQYLVTKSRVKRYPELESLVRENLPNIKRMAELSGCWSIWMHYFEGIPEVREMLLSFPGTNRQYFN